MVGIYILGIIAFFLWYAYMKFHAQISTFVDVHEHNVNNNTKNNDIIYVDSASVIETKARSILCEKCSKGTRIEDHTAETFQGIRVRRVYLKCLWCGAKSVYTYAIRSTN